MNPPTGAPSSTTSAPHMRARRSLDDRGPRPTLLLHKLNHNKAIDGVHALHILANPSFGNIQIRSGAKTNCTREPTKEQEELIKLLQKMDVPRFGGPDGEYFPPPPPPRPTRPKSCRYCYNEYLYFTQNPNPLQTTHTTPKTITNHPQHPKPVQTTQKHYKPLKTTTASGL